MSFIVSLLNKIVEGTKNFFEESQSLTKEWAKKNFTLKNILLLTSTSTKNILKI